METYIYAKGLEAEAHCPVQSAQKCSNKLNKTEVGGIPKVSLLKPDCAIQNFKLLREPTSSDVGECTRDRFGLNLCLKKLHV